MVSLIELSGDCPCPAPILCNDVLSVLKIKTIIIDEGYCLLHYFFFFFLRAPRVSKRTFLPSSHLEDAWLCCGYK